MPLRFSIRFLLAVTAVMAVVWLALRWWSDRLSVQEIAIELNRAGAQPYVWDHYSAQTYLESEVEEAHVTGVIPCFKLRFEALQSHEAIAAAAAMDRVTELTILNLEPSLTLGECDFRHLTHLHLGGATEAQLLEWIDAAGQLEDLSLAPKQRLSRATLDRIGRLRSLKVFRLADCRVSSGDVATLRRLPGLTHLSFYSCVLEAGVFEELATFPALNSVEVSGKTCDDKTVKSLLGLQNVESIDLTSSKVTDRGVQMIAEMRNLRRLTLYDCGLLTTRCVEDLRRMDWLEWLNVLATPIENDPELERAMDAVLAQWIM